MTEMTYLWIGVKGPINATQDDLENGAREAVARAGYQVGELIDHEEPFQIDNATHMGAHLQVEEQCWEDIKDEGATYTWGDYTVEIEVP